MSLTASQATPHLTVAPIAPRPNNGPMDERTLKEFGTRVRRRREALNLTRQALCAKAGITRTTLRNLEGGRQHPTPRTLAALIKALQVPEEALTGATPVRLDHPLLEDLTEEDLLVAQRFHHANTRTKQRILDLVEHLPSRLRSRALEEELDDRRRGAAPPPTDTRDASPPLEARLADALNGLDLETRTKFVDVLASLADQHRRVVESTRDAKAGGAPGVHRTKRR